MIQIRFCYCTHSTLAHKDGAGRCSALLCECQAFLLQATLIKGSQVSELSDGELLVIAQTSHFTSFDRLAAAALGMVSQSQGVKIWSYPNGFQIQYSIGGSHNTARGRTMAEAFRNLLKTAGNHQEKIRKAA